MTGRLPPAHVPRDPRPCVRRAPVPARIPRPADRFPEETRRTRRSPDNARHCIPVLLVVAACSCSCAGDDISAPELPAQTRQPEPACWIDDSPETVAQYGMPVVRRRIVVTTSLSTATKVGPTPGLLEALVRARAVLVTALHEKSTDDAARPGVIQACIDTAHTAIAAARGEA